MFSLYSLDVKMNNHITKTCQKTKWAWVEKTCCSIDGLSFERLGGDRRATNSRDVFHRARSIGQLALG